MKNFLSFAAGLLLFASGSFAQDVASTPLFGSPAFFWFSVI
jgi:hypothetical protein